MNTRRELQIRRTRTARRSVVALGAAGAVGAAVALGAGTVVATAQSATGTNDGGTTAGTTGGTATTPNRPSYRSPLTLVTPGGGNGTSHAQSSGS